MFGAVGTDVFNKKVYPQNKLAVDSCSELLAKLNWMLIVVGAVGTDVVNKKILPQNTLDADSCLELLTLMFLIRSYIHIIN